MPDYSKGQIYKIVNNVNDKVYYGSTIQTLSNRMAQHRQRKIGSINKLEVDITECKIILVENYPCNSKYELESRERYYIENFECVNKIIPTRSKKEYQRTDKRKEYLKKYHEENKEKLIKQRKEYNAKNKEVRKKRYEENKEEYLKKAKEYRQKNINKLKQKVTCECGCIVSYQHLGVHKKSKRHQKHLNN